MGAMTNLLVKDDSGTEITLIPVTDTPAPFWRSSIANVPFEGQIRFTMSEELLKSGARKYTGKLEVPVMETLGASGTSAGYVAPPAVAYVNTAIVTVFRNQRSTTADSSNLLKMCAGLISGASSVTATGVLDQSSANDAWKNSVLPITLAFTQGVMPN